MKVFRSIPFFILLLVVAISAGIWLFKQKKKNPPPAAAVIPPHDSSWQAPDTAEWASLKDGDQIRYGRDLISHTAYYLGPKGVVANVSNGMNCQNCHMAAGTRLFGNSFAAVAATYPKYRARSGRVESIEFRVNDCLLRSLNGHPIDSNGKEMQAMVAYLKWVGKEVPKQAAPVGAGTEKLPFPDRPADPQRGRTIYMAKCQQCHGANGSGLFNTDSSAYVYPPLWGQHSYNVSAGLYRLSSLAGFIKNNMPFGATKQAPQLTADQAWDVAAFINSQPRPQVFFKQDWPDITKKPEDYPFGPYADTFSQRQHKYGPFGPISKKKDKT